MRSRVLLTILFTALLLIMVGCGGTANCPTCGSTNDGQGYTDILNIVGAGAQSNRRAGRPI